MFDREHRYLAALETVVQDVDAAVVNVPRELPAIPGLPANLTDSSFLDELEDAHAAAEKAVKATESALETAREAIKTQSDVVGEARLAYKKRRAEYADALAQAQKALGADIDAGEFREVQQRVDDARAAKKALPGAQSALNQFEAKRRHALVEREKTFAEQARRLQSAGDSVSAKLSRVRVSVRAGADLRAFREFATRNLKGL